MGNNQMSEQQLNALINLAGQKLGADPTKIKESLSQGNTQNLLNNLNPQQRTMLSQALSNPKAAEQLLNSPQAKAMINRMMGGK